MIRWVNSDSRGTISDLPPFVWTRIIPPWHWVAAENEGLWPLLLAVKTLHKSSDCAIIGNQLAKTLQEAEVSNSLKLYLSYYMLGWLQEQQIAMQLMQTMPASLTSFPSLCRPVMRHRLTHSHNALTNHLAVWKRHRQIQEPWQASKLASTTPLHQRFHILDVPKTDAWLGKSSSARLQTHFGV